MKPKVLIIFPHAPNQSDASHYPYWHEVFQKSSQSLDLTCIYENQVNPLRRFFAILKNVQKGYRNVYIHYSYWSVIMTRVIKLFIPVKIYYWDCEWYETKPNNRLLNIALNWCDVLVTGSQSIGEQYRKTFKLNHKTIKIVPNWSEKIDVEPLQLNKDMIHILFVHHLSPRKGSRELPEIIRETIKSIPNAHFHIIGDGPSRVILEEAFAQGESPASGIHSNKYVTFNGSLSLSETRRFFASCNMLIMPSRSEGFPRVILEAMNYGLPIVATDVGNVRELVGTTNQQYIVPPNDPNSFVNSLIKLVKNQSLQDKIIAENNLQAKQFTLNNSILSFTKLFQQKHQ